MTRTPKDQFKKPFIQACSDLMASRIMEKRLEQEIFRLRRLLVIAWSERDHWKGMSNGTAPSAKVSDVSKVARSRKPKR